MDEGSCRCTAGPRVMSTLVIIRYLYQTLSKIIIIIINNKKIVFGVSHCINRANLVEYVLEGLNIGK